MRSFIINHLAINLKPIQKLVVNSCKKNARLYFPDFDKFEHAVREYCDKIGFSVSTFIDDRQLRIAEDEKFSTDDFIVITLNKPKDGITISK